LPAIEFGCRPTIIGSMPHLKPEEAYSLITRHLKDFPAWPQLPVRSFFENMYVQFSQGFPGIVIEGLEGKKENIKGRFYIDRNHFDDSLEFLYKSYLENTFENFPIRPEYAAGLHHFLNSETPLSVAVKGQVTGPISWGLYVTDSVRKPVIYDDTLIDAAAKLLRLKVAWQEQELRRINKHTIIFVDEPYMSSIGSAYVSVPHEKILSLIEEVLGGIQGLKGIHCCGNMDWSILFKTKIDIVSFDAYNYADAFTLYLDDITQFLKRSGTIAWGIIPTHPDSLTRETISTLRDRLFEAMAAVNRGGIPFRQIVRQSIITPSCGLATLDTNDAAENALTLLTGLSEDIRRKYNS
jgi:methionine synthase II (cobalamin-independent)